GPRIGLTVGLTIAIAVMWIVRRATPRKVDSTFRRGQLVSAALYSLGHGGNDAQKTMGIIFVLLIAATAADPTVQWRDRYVVNDATLAELSKDKDALTGPVLEKLKALRERTRTEHDSHSTYNRRPADGRCANND